MVPKPDEKMASLSNQPIKCAATFATTMNVLANRNARLVRYETTGSICTNLPSTVKKLFKPYHLRTEPKKLRIST